MDTHDTERKQLSDNVLRIHTLGRFQVSYGDKKLFEETGRYQKIGDLLMYFITHRNKPAQPEAILETLWPDQEYTSARNIMKNLVYRLKQSLEELNVPDAKSFITSTYGGYSWNSNAHYWLDVDVFEALCEEAHLLVKNEPALAIEKYREALSLYLGHYYPERLDSQWVLPKRHFYRRLFLKSVSELFAAQKALNLFDQMAEDCEKVLNIESFDESIHLFYLEALLEEGKITQARNHYEYITSLNYNEVGAKPSSAMRRLYKLIKASAEKDKVDLDGLQKGLFDEDLPQKALFCDPDTFRLLCRLEKNRAERAGQPVHLGLLTLNGPDLHPPTSSVFREHKEQLKKVLQDCLRKVDVIASLNEDQFALLLPGLDVKQSEIVLKRIEGTYQACNNPHGNFALHSTIHSILTVE